MSSYPIHFHAGSRDTARAKLPKGLPISLQLTLAGKEVCVPFYDADGTPILFLYSEEEYCCWKEQLPQEILLESHCRLLQLLAQPVPAAKKYLAVSKRLLAYAHITCDAELCFRSDGLVWLVPSQEMRT